MTGSIRLIGQLLLALILLARSAGGADEGVPPLLAAEKTLGSGAYISRNAPERGILLHLHGCNGLGSVGFSQAWFRYFEQAGFKVVAPNSFAEARPEPSCKTAPPFPNQEEINDLRVKQTLRVTDLLRQAYPGQPIYVWGHSEGASVSYLLPAPYAGIIATGHVCGHRAMAIVKVPKNVPLLALMGSDAEDIYLSMNIRAGSHGSLGALCQRVLGANPTWRWVQYSDLGHFIPIWHPGVLAEVGKLMGLDRPYQGADDSMSTQDIGPVTLTPAAQQKFDNEYRKARTGKAFAVAAGGTWGYATAQSLRDARLNALYICNGFLGSSFPAQKCVIYAEGDTIILGR